MSATRNWFLLILLVFLFQTINYARTTPPFEASDEAAHFLYAHNLLESRSLPVIVPREELPTQPQRSTLWAIESHQPPLYYALGALLIAGIDRSDIDAYLQPNPLIFTMDIVEDNPNKWLHPPERGAGGDTARAVNVLRLLSMVLGAGTLWFVYLTGAEVSGRKWVGLLAAGLVASVPTFVAISGSVNNDNMVTLLYSAGVYVCVRAYAGFTWREVAALMLIIPLATLSKITGASLYGLLFVTLGLAVWRGTVSRRKALQAFGVVVIAGGLIAGWWFLRNVDLYGDPLALEATQSLWARDYEIAETSGDAGTELLRVYRSFWFMIGHLHQPVYGPVWLYLYAGLLMLIAGAGGVRGWRSAPVTAQDRFLILLTAVGLLGGMLAVGTRSVDISYGRLLFPMLAAFATMMIVGLWSILRQPVIVGLALVPLAAATLSGWSTILPREYPRLQTLPALPEAVPFLGADAGGLSMVAYQMPQNRVDQNDVITFDLYLRGASPANPALFVTVVDPITLEPLGNTAIYPGMAPTAALDAETLYRVPVRVPLNPAIEPARPRQVQLRLEWFDTNTLSYLPITDGTGRDLETLFLSGPVLTDSRYDPDAIQQGSDIIYGDAIMLTGYSITERFDTGRTFDVTLRWQVAQALADDWTLTVQLLNEGGRLLDQADGVILGYPSSTWVEDTRFTLTRPLRLPDDTASEVVQIVAGWYRVTDQGFDRLPATGAGTITNDLFRLAEIPIQ
jgi:4-amino-4-deoxy-L-arabinose transferase-like glycosyltransferase